MDTKRKTVNSTKCKYNKKDIKMCGSESLKSSALSTPPQTKNCRTPLISRKSRVQDEFDGYNSEEASPVLLSTQEGGRGCEVTWDWRSPNRNELTPHNTPKEKVRRRVHHKNNVSPLLHIPCKRKLQQPVNKNFFDNLHAQLAEIQQKYHSSKTSCPNKSPVSSSTKNIPVEEEEKDISQLPTQILPTETTTLSPEKRETSGISDFFRDDSFTDYLITCSQAVENSIRSKVTPDLNKNNITRKDNQREKSPELIFDDEIANYPSDLQSTPKIPTADSSVKEKQFKNLSTKSPKFGNDDSFDAILSTFSEEAFAEYSDGSDKKITNCDILSNSNKLTSVGSVLNFTSNLQSIEEDKEYDFLNVKNNKSKPTNTVGKDSSKTGFSRHNSMPISPRVLGSNFQQGSIGRHNSMPYNSGNKFNNQRQRSFSDRTDSMESLGSQSCSPIQCTPDEIEKKRQDALRKKEARRIKLEIERKRREAIEKLQMKNKLQIRKNPR